MTDGPGREKERVDGEVVAVRVEVGVLSSFRAEYAARRMEKVRLPIDRPH